MPGLEPLYLFLFIAAPAAFALVFVMIRSWELAVRLVGGVADGRGISQGSKR